MIDQTTEYHRLPKPDELTTREKEDAMGAYFMMFASLAAGLPLPVINLIAAIIYYYLNKGKGRFVKFHALQSLLSQLPLSLMNAIAVFWLLRTIFWEYGSFDDYLKGYLIAIVIANIVYIVFSIVAAVRARKGRFYYFIFFGKIAYHNVYRVREGFEEGEEDYINQPPKM